MKSNIKEHFRDEVVARLCHEYPDTLHMAALKERFAYKSPDTVRRAVRDACILGIITRVGKGEYLYVKTTG